MRLSEGWLFCTGVLILLATTGMLAMISTKRFESCAFENISKCMRNNTWKATESLSL